MCGRTSTAVRQSVVTPTVARAPAGRSHRGATGACSVRERFRPVVCAQDLSLAFYGASNSDNERGFATPEPRRTRSRGSTFVVSGLRAPNVRRLVPTELRRGERFATPPTTRGTPLNGPRPRSCRIRRRLTPRLSPDERSRGSERSGRLTMRARAQERAGETTPEARRQPWGGRRPSSVNSRDAPGSLAPHEPRLRVGFNRAPRPRSISPATAQITDGRAPEPRRA